jgi:biogenesis of lysosome-related organelles complex 1 subunit 2
MQEDMADTKSPAPAPPAATLPVIAPASAVSGGVPATTAANTGTALDVATKVMFEKLSAYLSAEVALSVQDYNLLAQLNSTAAQTYGGMADRAVDLVGLVESVTAQYNTLKPSLEQINELDDKVGQLEVVVRQLDAYTIRLHDQFKKAYNL